MPESTTFTTKQTPMSYDKIIPVRITVTVNDDPKVTHVVNFRCAIDPYQITPIDFSKSPEWVLEAVTVNEVGKEACRLMCDDIASPDPCPYNDYEMLTQAQAIDSIFKQGFPTLH